MTKFKKFLTVSIAGVMALSATAFAACTPDDNEGDDNTPTGNLPAVGIDPSQPNAALLNGVLAQEYKAAGYTMSMNTTTDYKYYESDEDYSKGDLISGKEDKETDNMSQTAKINPEDGDADIYVEQVRSSTIYKYDNRTVYTYAFLRDWNLFEANNVNPVTGKTEKITDFSNVTMSYLGNALENMSGFSDILGENNEYTNLALGTENFTILALGNYFGGLTVTDTTATVDLNKTVYNIVSQINALLDTVDENTKIGDLLANDAVKKVLTSVLSSMPAEKVLEIVNTALDSVPMIGPMLSAFDIDLSKILVKPDKDMSSYDYLVKVISSDELTNAINKVLVTMQQNVPNKVTLPANVDQMKISFFLNLAGLSVNDVKAQVKEYTKNITATTIDITTYHTVKADSKGPDYVEGDEDKKPSVPISYTLYSNNKISNAKVVYTLDGNKITKQDISATVNHDGDDYDYDYEWDNVNNKPNYTYYYIKEIGTATLNMSVDYPTTKYTLTDISGCKTVESRTEYKESEEGNIDLYLGRLCEYEGGKYQVSLYNAYYTVKSVVEDGVITGYLIKAEDDKEYKALGDTLTVSVTLTPYFSDEESEPINVDIVFDIEYTCEYIPEKYELPMVTVSNNKYGISDRARFYPQQTYYTNTVAGILAGTESTYAPDYNN